MDLEVFKHIISTLDVLVIEFQDKQSLRILGDLPPWYQSLTCDNCESSNLPLMDTFPFLTCFLEDAWKFWEQKGSDSLKSGVWVEINQSGAELPLEATAIKVSKQNILLISLFQLSYDEKISLIQKNRENNLAHRIERKQSSEQLRQSILYDQLTGLPNQSFVRLHLADALAQVYENSDHSFTLIYIDIKRFNAINTRLGLAAGDQLLMIVAQRLVSQIREDDIAARLGADDFAVLLKHTNGEHEALQIVDRIQNQLLAPYLLNAQEIQLQVDIGIAIGNSHYQNAENLIRDACTAMEHAKLNGTQTYEVFHETMHLQTLARTQLEHDLASAILKDELRVCYQPIISLRDGSLHGFEALVRWQHPTLGLLSPGRFISIAEDSGLIIPIGTWILHEACQQIKHWREQTSLPLKVHVNLSAKQLDQSDLFTSIQNILLETQLESEGLELEITETMVFDNIQHAVSVLNRIKTLGVKLSMDDFGTGYASLSYLHQLPVDNLKIDRSFVEIIDASGKDSEIIKAVIQLAHSLNIDVVAEGVETAEQAQHLQRLDCEYAQGYLFSKPIDTVEVDKLLGCNYSHFLKDLTVQL